VWYEVRSWEEEWGKEEEGGGGRGVKSLVAANFCFRAKL